FKQAVLLSRCTYASIALSSAAQTSRSNRVSDITKIAQGTELESQISAESVQEVVSALYTELHHAQADPGAVGLNSRLDRDLGFDSLGRVELVSRLEQRFGVHLPAAALSLAETVADLIALVNSAANAGGIQPRFAT